MRGLGRRLPIHLITAKEYENLIDIQPSIYNVQLDDLSERANVLLTPLMPSSLLWYPDVKDNGMA